MTDRDGPQFDLRPEEEQDKDWLESRPTPPRWPMLIAALLLIAGALAYYLYHRSRAGAGAAAPPPAASHATPATPGPPGPSTEQSNENLPSLDASDEWVRLHAADLSSNPQFAKSLAGDDLIRRFVVSVLNSAEGVSPRKHLPRLAPAGAFKPDMVDGEPALGETSYQRYDRLARMIGSLDAKTAARLYRVARPLLNQAYRELGFPDESFDSAVVRALHRVQSTPAISGAIELQKGVKSYKFKDPALESLSDLQKQLLRMGPRNRDLIEKKFTEIVDLLGLEDSTQ